MSLKLSVVIPVYNEEANLEPLYNDLKNTLDSLNLNYEVIWVNDGSRDNSEVILQNIAAKDPHNKVINFSRNFGQTAAMSAGIKAAQGEIIVPMDADRQNDPRDIPRLLNKLEDGYDVVSGWRKNRQDKLVSRRIPSQIANWLIGVITGVKIHDYGCSLKAYRAEVIKGVNLYGEMHRFIPAYASWQGGRVAEIVVNHRPRIAGETKYGISRTFRVILDLIIIKFLSQYINRPIHFFGGVGLMAGAFGFLTGLLALILRFTNNISISRTPLPILSALLVIVGIQLLVMGVLAEMIMRTYYESQHKDPYAIKNKINL